VFVGSGGVDAAFDADLLQQIDEAEAARYDANRADDGRRVSVDFIARDGEKIAARGCDVLTEYVNALFFLGGQLPDAFEEQVRLNGRTARRIDDHRYARQLRC